MEETKTILSGGDSAVVDEQQIVPNEAADKDSSVGAGDTFDYSGMIDSQGFLGENWRECLPEDLRGEPCLDSIKNFTTLAKSYVNAQKMIGKNKIALPDQNSTQEEKDAFYSALGRPDAADKYSVDNVELPEGITLDEGAMQKFREFAFSQNLSQDVFEQALAFDIERFRAAQEMAVAAQNKEYDETMSKLQQQYGSNLPARIAQVDKALTTFGIKEIFLEKALTNNYQIFEALAKIGESISESKLKNSDISQSVSTPQQQLDAIYADPDNPIYHFDHPGHDRVVAEAKRLVALISQG